MDEFHKEFEGEKLAETWELSCHEAGQVTILNGPDRGKTLKDYIQEKGNRVLGTGCRSEKELPILIKLIDAKDQLSVQVHPDDVYAMVHSGQKGKTEVWYIVDCKEKACIYYGFSRRISKEELKERIENKTLIDVLNKVRVKKGDVFFIEAGTIHAIGADILVAEIQENSNITYRIYDYGRVGTDGKERSLDIDKALDVLNMEPIESVQSFSPHMVSCEYFTVDKLYLDGIHMKSMKGFAGLDSFVHLLIIDGDGTIQTKDDIQPLCKGDSVFLPAGSGMFELDGKLEVLLQCHLVKKK